MPLCFIAEFIIVAVSSRSSTEGAEPAISLGAVLQRGHAAIMAVDYFSNPPPGIDLSESRTAANNAVGIVLFVLSAIFVGLRWLTRMRYQRAELRLDDWLMLLGLVLNGGNLACCIAGMWKRRPLSRRNHAEFGLTSTL